MSEHTIVTRPGCRPYCKHLIETEGIIDETALLTRVHERFPEKQATFTMSDVRFQLRLAGKLPWTGRKGVKPTR